MKRTALVAALALPTLLAVDAATQKIAYSPAAGGSVSKTYKRTSEVTLEDMEMMMGGQDVGAMMGELEMNLSNTVELTFVDQYVSVADGHPTKLKRKFESMHTSSDMSSEMPMMGEPMEVSMSGSSELEGKTVVFTAGDDGAVEVAFDEDSEGDDELLEGLEENLDFRAFLPKGEVKEGEEWAVEPNALRPAFAPSGSIKMNPEAEGDSPLGGMGGGRQPQMDQVLDVFEGEVMATYAGTREEEGVKVAVIKLAIDVESANDLSDFADEMMSEMEFPGMEIEMDVEAFDVEYRFEGEGELLWNLATGLPYRLEISGESTMITDQTIHMVLPGQEQTMEQSMTMGGTENIAVEFD